jgi:hypothetical protein
MRSIVTLVFVIIRKFKKGNLTCLIKWNNQQARADIQAAINDLIINVNENFESHEMEHQE